MGKGCEVGGTVKSGALEEDVMLLSRKKRKFHSDLENELVEVMLENPLSPAASRTSGSSKHDESSDVVERSSRAPDLENVESQLQGLEREIRTSTDGRFSREATPTSELCGDSEEVLTRCSTPTKKLSTPPLIPRRKIPTSVAEKMPSAAELEEFFAAAEKYEHERFIEKYNYDVVKDVPQEGKYQWVRLQP